MFNRKENIIIVNGKTYHVSGNNVSIVNQKVIVDGKVIEDGLSGIVKIEWKGELANLNCNSADVHGDIQGNVECNNLRCKDIKGNVDSNNVCCENIGGNVDATIVTKK